MLKQKGLIYLSELDRGWQEENAGLSVKLSERNPQIFPQKEDGLKAARKAKAPASGAFAAFLLQFSGLRALGARLA
ncbi:MAG: hypothetical protein WBE03_00525 [Terracidiphilus sp.]